MAKVVHTAHVLPFLLLLGLVLCSPACHLHSKGPRYGEIPAVEVEHWCDYQSGKASWYGGRWNHCCTASGETYDQNTMTAAHRTLPFGTQVRVTNLNNGRQCVVRINNRGPFAKGRVIDLSVAAARAINAYDAGIVPVRLEVVK